MSRFSSLIARLRKPALALKANPVGALISMARAGQPAWMSRDVTSFAEEGYRKNVIAFRAINMIADGAASIPMVVVDQAGEVLEDHPLAKLLRRPNPMQGGGEFWEAWFSFLEIAGNTYQVAVGPKTGPPTELWTLRPDRMTVIPNVLGMPTAFNYRVGGKDQRFDTDHAKGIIPVLHLKTFNPLDDFYGMSPIEAAAFSVDQHNAAGAWQKALLDNSGAPSGALIYTPQGAAGSNPNLSSDQKDAIREQLEQRHTGAANAGRILLLDGGLDWKQMALSPRDMDWIKGKDVSARDVALAFGVPAQLVGVPDAQTYSNNREARLAMWEDTIVPLFGRSLDALNAWLPPKFEDDVKIVGVLDDIPALGPRMERIWDKVSNANFLTINEKREMVGKPEVAGGDVIFVDATKLPLDLAIEGPPDVPVLALPPPEDEEKKIARMLGVAPPQSPEEAEAWARYFEEHRLTLVK